MKSPISPCVFRGLIHSNSSTRIGCWNVRTLGSLGDQSAQLLSVIDTMKSKHMESQMFQGTTIVYSGNRASHNHGVAILLSPRAKTAWEAAGSEFQPVSERILKIRLKCHLSYMSIISVYAPTNPTDSTSESAQPSEIFYDQLQSTLSSVPPSDLLVIMGDFNARVGSDYSNWRSVLGPHGIGECNENGKRLLDFCTSNQLLVTNTWFQHKLLH